MIRIDKFLAEMSVGTRSEVKKMIRAGRVSVNDEEVKRPEQKVDPDNDIVSVDGNPVIYSKYEYFMLNKPAGYVSAVKDDEHMTVLELISEKSRNDLFPVGRLDIDTEGLLLITNDGEISHKLLSPKSHVDKTYFLLTKGRVTDDDVDLLEKGIDLGDEKLTLPAEVSGVSVVKWDDIKSYHDNILSSKEFDTEDKTGEFSSLYLTIHEGRYHQVKRMMAKVGKPVLYLKRVTMGTLKLDGKLSVGDYRKLTEKEVEELKLLCTPSVEQ